MLLLIIRRFVLSIFALLAAGNLTFAESITLRIITANESAAPLLPLKSKIFEPINKSLNQSGNKFKIEWTFIDTKNKHTSFKAIQLLRAASADVALLSLLSLAKRLPLQTIAFQRPATGVNSSSQLAILNILSDQMPELRQEYYKQELVPLALVMGGRKFIAMNKPIDSIAKFKGMRIAMPRDLFRLFAGTGVRPASIKWDKLNASLETGKVDGAVIAPAIKEFSTISATVSTLVDVGLAAIPDQVFVISKSKWDTLPATVQNIIRSAFSRYEKNLAQTIVRSETSVLRRLQKKLQQKFIVDLRAPFSDLVSKLEGTKKTSPNKKPDLRTLAIKKYDSISSSMTQNVPR